MSLQNRITKLESAAGASSRRLFVVERLGTRPPARWKLRPASARQMPIL